MTRHLNRQLIVSKATNFENFPSMCRNNDEEEIHQTHLQKQQFQRSGKGFQVDGGRVATFHDEDGEETRDNVYQTVFGEDFRLVQSKED